MTETQRYLWDMVKLSGAALLSMGLGATAVWPLVVIFWGVAFATHLFGLVAHAIPKEWL